ncbi:GNAT family N-acetyltransferase [Pseudalkalibacillus decolorationis]|uniref:GNAT family N-acetyltransferase n=1 Tax=Pseudalkalibacillus decolorationis TaxID=163879 RepID=UPI002148A0F5|nr:GNAT family N-acetyltransferase [Pseudalkalibacillus decolorationis]
MKLLFEGTLNNNEQFKVLPLSLDNLNQILALQEIVIESLENKDTLQPLTKEEFQYILEGNGLIIGAFVEEQLIAFRALLVPPIDEEHLGWDLGLAEEDLASVIYQEISNVHPVYRGNRLQQTLAILVMQELGQDYKDYSYICCTVAPFNIPSLKDKFNQGMEITALKEKYGGRVRYVFVKEIAEERDRDWTEVATARMDNMAAQQALLTEGWRGFQMENRDGEYWVDFGKKAK